MVVIVLESVPTSLRGELTRWLIEVKSGVFVGHLSARVRDKLWQKCCRSKKTGGVTQIWSTNTEQRFDIRMCGNTQREIVELEGLKLIRVPHKADTKKAARFKSKADL
jgi:CRISPR-associated protein Cas2